MSGARSATAASQRRHHRRLHVLASCQLQCRVSTSNTDIMSSFAIRVNDPDAVARPLAGHAGILARGPMLLKSLSAAMRACGIGSMTRCRMCFMTPLIFLSRADESTNSPRLTASLTSAASQAFRTSDLRQRSPWFHWQPPTPLGLQSGGAHTPSPHALPPSMHIALTPHALPPSIV